MCFHGVCVSSPLASEPGGSDARLFLISFFGRRYQNSSVADCRGSGFRAIRRDVARAVGMVEDTFTIEEEMVIKCLKHGCRAANVPSHEYERRHGRSNIRLELLWWRFAWCVIKNIF